MNLYLTPNDPGAFQDLEIRDIKHSYFITTVPVVCPLCKGYGRWNLTLNAYGPGKHFQAHCMQCNGYGWVAADSLNATCIHDPVELSYDESKAKGISHYGMFCHVYECSKCGNITSYDSSG